MRNAARTIVVIGAFLGACANSTTPDPIGGETHFLGGCDDGACGLGLECICGVCTKPCTTANTCKDLNGNATCEAAGTPIGACVNPQASPVCDVECDVNADCASLGTGYTCEQGSCRKVSAGACIDDGVLRSAAEVAADACLACRCRDDDMVCSCVDSGSCTVGAITYPEGATDVPDPVSCNRCTCTNGALTDCTTTDCPGTCQLLHAVTWQHSAEGGPVSDLFELTRDDDFLRRTPAAGSPCVTPLPECDAHELDVEDLNLALADPDVREALANAPSYYPDGVLDGAEIEVVIDGRQVRFGVHCYGASCNGAEATVPTGLLGLYGVLRGLERDLYCSTNAACVAPLDPGACFDAGLPRYYHDAATRSCQPFTAHCGGSGGNENNFFTESECIATCLSETFGVTEAFIDAAPEQACDPGATGGFEVIATEAVACPELDAVLALPGSNVVAFAPSPIDRMVVGNGEVFWREMQSLRRVSTSGGAVRGLSGSAQYDASALSIDGCHLYTAGADIGAEVVALSTDDGSSRTLAQRPGAWETSNIVVTPDALFVWVHHELHHIPRAGGPVLSLATREVGLSQSHRQVTLAADATHLYWTDPTPTARPGAWGHVLRMPMAASEMPSIIASDLPHPVALYQHGGALFVLSHGALDSVGNYSGHARIDRIDLATGDETLLAQFVDARDRPEALVVDDTHVYWANQPSASTYDVLRAPHEGIPVPQIVIAGLAGRADNFTADATHLYWSGACEVSGTSRYFIVRVPKPASL